MGSLRAFSRSLAKALSGRVVFIKPFFSACPQHIISIYKQRMNKIASNTARLIGIITEYLKTVSIKPVQAILGAEPQKSFSILYTADNSIIGKAVFYLVVTEIVRLTS